MEIKYRDDGKYASVDGFKFTRDDKTGYYLSSKKIGEKRIRLHVYIWEKYNGKIKSGLSIHHIDGNKANNNIDNFILMTNKKHCKHHALEMLASKYDDLIENLNVNARPKASEWHGSEAGKEWHKQHYTKYEDRFRAENEYECLMCGKKFVSKSVNSKFCSNNCKSQHRRKSGIDNVQKICEDCGGTYEANKYQKTKYCPLCKGNFRKRSRRRTSLQYGSKAPSQL